jgi:nitrate/nitrite-specific signal transduction histidine kinase
LLGQQRVGKGAHHVIEAARDADAVNRAGQLRMLSQRMVKLHALAVAGTDTAAARALLAQSMERAAGQLQHLERTLSEPTFGDLLEVVNDAFVALQAALCRSRDSSGLVEVDALAEELLAGADKLTAALENAGPTTTLHVINLSGRQRMLSQRLAKQALLGALADGPTARRAQEESSGTVQAFEHALERLNQVPLSTPEIRAMLVLAEAQWRLMLEGVGAVHTPGGRLTLAQASESLLALFEQLTERYERSMQVLIGQV